jgi:hypothetical protein
LKWGRYVLKNVDAMVKFYETPIEQLIKEAENAIDLTNLAQFMHYKAKLLYPFTTPSALVFLTCRGKVSSLGWRKLLASGQVQIQEELLLKLIERLLEELEGFETALARTQNRALKEAAERFILNMIGKETMKRIEQALLIIQRNIAGNLGHFSQSRGWEIGWSQIVEVISGLPA